MRARVTIGGMLLALAATAGAGAQSDPDKAQCVARPTRACVSALAVPKAGGMAGIETLVHVIEAKIGAADLKGAALTLGRIKAAAAALADQDQRDKVLGGAAILGTVLKAMDQASGGQPVAAQRTIDTIAEQAEESEYVSLLFATLAEALARNGRKAPAADVMDVATKLAGGVKDDAIRRMTQNDVAVRRASVQAQAGDFETARATSDGLQGLQHIDAENRIAEAKAAAKARAGRTEAALDSASDIDDAAIRIRAFCMVANIHGQAGRRVEEAEAIRRARVTLQSMSPGSEASEEAIARIARAAAKNARLVEGMKLADRLQNDVWRIVALDAVAAVAE